MLTVGIHKLLVIYDFLTYIHLKQPDVDPTSVTIILLLFDISTI